MSDTQRATRPSLGRTATAYVITTRPVGCQHSRVAGVVTRRAVATLEESEPYIEGFVSALVPWPSNPEATRNAAAQLRALVESEQGGTVGPLPDGTVIEVRAVETTELYDALPILDRDRLATAAAPRIIAAFNAAQDARAERREEAEAAALLRGDR